MFPPINCKLGRKSPEDHLQPKINSHHVFFKKNYFPGSQLAQNLNRNKTNLPADLIFFGTYSTLARPFLWPTFCFGGGAMGPAKEIALDAKGS